MSVREREREKKEVGTKFCQLSLNTKYKEGREERGGGKEKQQKQR